MDRRAFLTAAGAGAAFGMLPRVPQVACAGATGFATGEGFSDQSLIQNILAYLYETRAYWRSNRRSTDLLVRGLVRLYETGLWERLTLAPAVKRWYIELMQGYPAEIAAYWFASPTVDDALRMLLNQTLWLAARVPISGMEVTDGQQRTTLTLVEEALTGGNIALHYKLMTVKVFGSPTEFTPLPEAAPLVAECREVVQAALDRNSGSVGEYDTSASVQLEHQAAAVLAGFAASARPFLVYQDADGRWSSKIGVAASDISATGQILWAAWSLLATCGIVDSALWGIRSARVNGGAGGVATDADEDPQESSMWALLALASAA